MVASEHLNQLEFPGMPQRTSVWGSYGQDTPPAAPRSFAHVDDLRYDENDAHDPGRWDRDGDDALTDENPIYDASAWNDWRASDRLAPAEGRTKLTESEEFVPPWRVHSFQGGINNDAVAHQVRNANPLELRDDPDLHAYAKGSEEHYAVTDGNHRVVAAQRRGQLLMPANVQRWT